MTQEVEVVYMVVPVGYKMKIGSVRLMCFTVCERFSHAQPSPLPPLCLALRMTAPLGMPSLLGPAHTHTHTLQNRNGVSGSDWHGMVLDVSFVSAGF